MESGGELSVVRVRDLVSGKESQSSSLEDLYPDPGSLRWSAKGSLVVFSCYGHGGDGTDTSQIYSLDFTRSYPVAKWIKRGTSPNALSSGQILSFSESGIIFVNNEMHFKYLDAVSHIAQFPDGKRCALALNNSQGTQLRIAIADLVTNKIIKVFRQPKTIDKIGCLDVSPDGKHILFTKGSEKGFDIHIINLSTDKESVLVKRVAMPAVWATSTTFYYVPYVASTSQKLPKAVLLSNDLSGNHKSKVATLNASFTDCLAYHP
ncbi:MAG: hypothetical protein Q7S37_03370 [bacterium]|nr:hypothetical protein [bacterium]